ncbi:MAG: hypothetical protein J07AB43_02420 [Candidatus Nanosalina sp. J07AB43]|jgi:hypothetical protein|nr:MAG: hypothetical protein J07AB43_02420 [Candidatus Nanosalina sp. J07AB43]
MTEPQTVLDAVVFGGDTLIGRDVIDVQVPFRLAMGAKRNKGFSFHLRDDGRVGEEYDKIQVKYGGDKSAKVEDNTLVLTFRPSDKDLLLSGKSMGFPVYRMEETEHLSIDFIFLARDSIGEVTYEYGEVEQPEE